MPAVKIELAKILSDSHDSTKKKFSSIIKFLTCLDAMLSAYANIDLESSRQWLHLRCEISINEHFGIELWICFWCAQTFFEIDLMGQKNGNGLVTNKSPNTAMSGEHNYETCDAVRVCRWPNVCYNLYELVFNCFGSCLSSSPCRSLAHYRPSMAPMLCIRFTFRLCVCRTPLLACPSMQH